MGMCGRGRSCRPKPWLCVDNELGGQASPMYVGVMLMLRDLIREAYILFCMLAGVRVTARSHVGALILKVRQ
eukprot:scaffold256735_cov26-Tisochrysis_lutea.AAC.2